MPDAVNDPPFPQDLAAHLTTAWVYDRQIWQRSAAFINLASTPTPGVPSHVLTGLLTRLAPPRSLLAAYRAQSITWADFRTWYSAHLLRFSRWDTLRQIARQLTRVEQVVILGSEKAVTGDEAQAQCARQIFRAWLLGECSPGGRA